MVNRSLRLFALVTLIVTCALAALAATDYEVFVGTYTGPHSKGIYSFRFDSATGKWTPLELAAATENPSYLVVDRQGRFLYAVNETESYKGTNSGAVSAFAIDPATWKLTFLQQVSSLGGAPAYMTLDKTGHDLLVADYSGGDVAVFPVESDGQLGEHTALDQHQGSSVNPERQKGPHAHSIQMTNNDRFAMSADLGLDKIIIDRFDPTRGTLTPNDPPFATVAPGSGPRHLAFSRSGKFVYVINEMGTSVTVFSFDARTAAMRELQTISTVAKQYPANTGAEIQLDPHGRFLYTSTRGVDVITEFKVSPKSGKLTLAGRTPAGGKTPRFFTLDPTGRWMFVADQDSDTIVLFRVDENSGSLTQAGQIEIGSPVCLAFVPAKK